MMAVTSVMRALKGKAGAGSSVLRSSSTPGVTKAGLPRYARNDGSPLNAERGVLMRFDVLATVAGSLLFASSGIAAPPASAPQVWQVDWEGSRCSISEG